MRLFWAEFGAASPATQTSKLGFGGVGRLIVCLAVSPEILTGFAPTELGDGQAAMQPAHLRYRADPLRTTKSGFATSKVRVAQILVQLRALMDNPPVISGATPRVRHGCLHTRSNRVAGQMP